MSHKLSNERADEERKQERAEKWGDTPRVRCIGGFADGNLKQFFDDIGQDYRVLHNEVRNIPAWLLERCIQSGGRFEIVL